MTRTLTTTSIQKAETASNQVPIVNHFHRIIIRLMEAKIRNRHMDKALICFLMSEADFWPAVRDMSTGLTLLWIKWNRAEKEQHLNNYFDFHVRLSMVPSVRSVRPCVRKLTSIPAEVLQKVTNKSCLVCVKSKKYASWVTIRPQWDCCCRDKAEVRIIDFKITWSEFQMPSQTAPAEVLITMCDWDFKW